MSVVPAPDAAVPRARASIAVALFNDTGDQAHVGCLAVSAAHRRMLRRVGAIVRHAHFSRDWLHLANPVIAHGIEAALGTPDLRQVFSGIDVVVVNGEGTIHHGYGRHLLAILGAAQRVGLPTFLVNAVLEDVDDAREVLAALTDCTVRDARSACYLRSLEVPHRLVPDSFVEAPFLDRPAHDFSGRLVITDVHPDCAGALEPALQALRAAWRGPLAEYPLEAPVRVGDWPHALADIEQALAVVTGRHHGACLALRAGTPFVTLPSNTWKIEGLLDLLDGYPAAAADVSRPLIERVEAALAARDWFAETARQWRGRLPLDTFSRLRVARGSRAVVPAPTPVNRHTLDAVRLVTRPGGGVLHCGAGDGALVRALLAGGIDARGVDVAAAPAVGRASDRFSPGVPGALPFADEQFFTLVASPGWLEHLEDDELDGAIAELARVAREAIVLETTGQPLRADRAVDRARPRTWWEQRCLDARLRRHTRTLAIVDYEALEDDAPGTVIVLQKLPAPAASRHPLAGLRAERDRHMDMLRETGRRADAHVARYEWARSWIKPGDVVVDAACGLGYGTALLWDGSEAARVTGLDISEGAVAYARDCFGPGRPGVEFAAADVEGWEGWPDHSVDCVVSFETLERLADPARFVDGVRRVLRPGGRFLCSVSNRWIDETGRHTNPHHRQTFDLDRLVRTVSPAVLVDEVYAQSAGGHSERFAPRRLLRNVGWPDTVSVSDAEWWLLSGVKDPVAGAGVPYAEQVFPAPDGGAPHAIAFGRDYVNPWAVHALVMGSFRVRSPRLLQQLAERWHAAVPPRSADAGAALCILAYREVERGGAEAASLLARIRDYRAGDPVNAHARRWQVSLRFVQGQLHVRRGELQEAEACFRGCAAEDATAFAPHLETKTTEAAWLAGRLALERGDAPAAASDWTGVANALERLKRAPVAGWLVTPERPAAFEAGDGLREVALAVDNATLCANGLRRLREPSGTWRPGPGPLDRNLQRDAGRLLAVVHDRGGEILAWRSRVDRDQAELRRVHDHWRETREALHDVQRQLQERVRADGLASARTAAARARAERAVLAARARRRRLRRVAIVGAGDVGRRVWDVLSRRETVEVVAFVDDDPCRRGLAVLGTAVQPTSWLARAAWDAAVAAMGPDDEPLRRLIESGVDHTRVFLCPADLSEGALQALAAGWFPDPPHGASAGAEVPAGVRAGIFGTGEAGMKVWEALAEVEGVEVVWFADNNRWQQGRDLLGIDIIAPSDVPSRGGDAIVIASASHEAIRAQLRALNIPDVRMLVPDARGTVAQIRRGLGAAFDGRRVRAGVRRPHGR